MQAPYNDRWERTKRYLLRNFLVNPGFRLSPIPEEEQSSPDSGSLPDLFIEPEPNRHDDPPDFYEGLERRMKRYYRQLFLDESDDSSDFEVNRSMASTFMLDTDARKDNEASILAEENSKRVLDDPIAKKRKLTKSTNETDEIRQVTKSTNESLDDENESQAEFDDRLFDTCASYNHTRHISADSKSSVEDAENLKLIETRSINESIHSYKSDDTNVNIDKDQPNTAKDDIDNTRRDLNEISFKINETESDSEDAVCHRISTTVAEVHEPRPERRPTQVFDNGSPVLIPRLLQFSKSLFGSRKSSESFNVSEASNVFIRRLSSRKYQDSNKHDDDIEEPETQVQRLIAASELTRASLDSKLDTEHIIENIDTEDKIHEDDVDKYDNFEDRANFEDIIQPHEITRASFTSNKPLDTVNIDDYTDNEEDLQEKYDSNSDIEDRSSIEDIIQPHVITRACLVSNKTLETENIEDYADTEDEPEDDKNDDIEDRTGIEDIIQPHEITRASLASKKTRDTKNIVHYTDTEEDEPEGDDKNDDIEDRTGIEDIIQPHEITRASLASNKTRDTKNIVDYTDTDTEENEQDDKNYDIEDRSSIEDIIQPREMTRASLASNKTLDTENIEDYADTEEDDTEGDDKNDDIEDRTGIEDIIQPHEITRASLASNKTLDTANIEDYADTEEDEPEGDDKNDDIEDRTGIEDIIQPHEITRASLASNKTRDTKNIVDYTDTDTEEKEQDDKNDYDIEDRSSIEDIIQPHEMTTDSNKTRESENIEVYADTKRKKQAYGKTYDVEDNSPVSEIQCNEEDEIDTDVENESDIRGMENTSINWNKDGIVFARKARKTIFISSSDESFDDMEPIAQSSAKSIEYEEVEVMREEAGGNERWSWHGEAVNQDSPTLAFEAQTNASDKPENYSSDSTEINASFEEMEKYNEDTYDTNEHDVANIIDEFWSVSSKDVDIESPKEVLRSNNNNEHYVANTIDEFWSVSPEDVDIESPKEVLRSNKRKTDSGTDVPTKRKKDTAIQTSSGDYCRNWEDVRSEFFVGTPLVFRLCDCQDHVCS